MISIFLSLSLLAQVERPQFDPRLNWQTMKTDHFWIHHPENLKDTALDLANRAETMWDVQTGRFNYIPSYPIHLILSDQVDNPNGLSTPIPYNAIYLYPVPPTDDSALDDYDDWLNTLFVHEFTHSLHLDMAEGVNKIPRLILGRFWVPNAAQQQWAHEGLAINYETNETTRGRGRSSFLEMFFRTASLEDSFIGIDRATYYNDEYPFGNAAYYYGIGFHQYIERVYGKDKMTEFAHVTARNPVPSALNFKTKKIFGKSFHRLWEEWKLEEKSKWNSFRTSVTSSFRSTPLENGEWKIQGVPVWHPDGERFFASVRKDGDVQIREFKKDPSSSTFKSSIVVDDLGVARLALHKDQLVYASSGRDNRYRSTLDLNVYDLQKKKSFRITRGLRVRDPVVLNGFVYMIRTDAFRSQLVRLPWSLVEKAMESEKPIRSVDALEVLYKAEGYDALSKPAVHPSSSELVFSMKKTNANRDLYALDLSTKQIRQLTDDPANDHHPQFSDDGRSIIYASDPDFPGTSQRVPNLVSLDLNTRQLTLITDALTGVSFPAVSKNQIAAGVYHSEGYELHLIPLDLAKGRPLATQSSPSVQTRSFKQATIQSESTYSIGSTLLPRFLAPIFLYTDSDVLLGAQSLSYDPLSRHIWLAAAYHRFEPNRPAGYFSYIFGGLTWAKVVMSLSTSLTDYGDILIVLEPNGSNEIASIQKYFERSTVLSGGLSIPLSTDESRTNWNLGLFLYGEDRRSEFGIPANALTGVGNVGDIENVLLSPQAGQTLGGRISLGWSDGYKFPLQYFSPTAGKSFSLGVDYSPPVLTADFHTLTTIATGKYFLSPWLEHAIGLQLTAGYQWLDVLYQHAFTLGGALGEGPLSSANRQSYSLRGLPQSFFRGEGLLVGSLEYRFPLFRTVPGLGTSPLWLKNLHGALFSDIGQTFTQLQDQPNLIEAINPNSFSKRKFSLSRFNVSVGAELRSDASLFYLPPLTFRLGYARVLYLQGSWIGSSSRPVDEIYLQAGPSF